METIGKADLCRSKTPQFFTSSNSSSLTLPSPLFFEISHQRIRVEQDSRTISTSPPPLCFPSTTTKRVAHAGSFPQGSINFSSSYNFLSRRLIPFRITALLSSNFFLRFFYHFYYRPRRPTLFIDDSLAKFERYYGLLCCKYPFSAVLSVEEIFPRSL